MSGEKRWQEGYFHRHYRVIHAHQSEAEARREVESIARMLRLKPGASVLDLGCGYGRHAFPLVDMGYDVTGIDEARYMVAQARRGLRKEGPNPRFQVGDLRRMKFREAFDAAISVYTSFGYHSEDENIEILRRSAAALKPGGRLLIDINHHDALVVDVKQSPRSWRRLSERTFLMDEFRYDPRNQRLCAKRILVKDAQVAELTFEFRSYTCREMETMLSSVGLQPEGVYGSLIGAALDASSKRLVVVAVKGGPSEI